MTGPDPLRPGRRALPPPADPGPGCRASSTHRPRPRLPRPRPGQARSDPALRIPGPVRREALPAEVQASLRRAVRGRMVALLLG